MSINKSIFSSNSDEWATPINLFTELNNKYKFTLDPCATESNHKCNKYYTINDNGLIQDWSNEVVFCNPPYSKIKDWVKKCYEESSKGAKIVLLIPSRTDTTYFHSFIYHKANLIFIKGRLKFNDGKGSAPFPSMLCLFNLE